MNNFQSQTPQQQPKVAPDSVVRDHIYLYRLSYEHFLKIFFSFIVLSVFARRNRSHERMQPRKFLSEELTSDCNFWWRGVYGCTRWYVSLLLDYLVYIYTN